MAANKFATMVHRNTNKITFILIYAVLEWILIVLLLLNSLFSYLIIKYAEYFGLKPPCLWCTRLDHIFEPQKVKKNTHRDLLCEAHAKEISKLGYCSNHRKLARSTDMCEDCLFSRSEFQGALKNVNIFEWMKELGMIHSDDEKLGENGEVSLNCSCCGVVLDNKDIFSSYILLKPSWNVLEATHKENLIKEPGDYVKKLSDFAIDSCYDEQEVEKKNETQILSEVERGFSVTINESEENDSVSVSVSMNELKESGGGEVEKVDINLSVDGENGNNLDENPSKFMEDKSAQVSVDEDTSVQVSNQHLEFFLDYSGHKLVPIELIDSVTGEDHKNDNFKDYNTSENEDSLLDSEVKLDVGNRSVQVEDDAELDFDLNEVPEFSLFDMDVEEDENFRIFHAKECHFEMDVLKDDTYYHVFQTPFKDVDEDEAKAATEGGNEHSIILPVSEEVAQIPINETETETETEAEVSIGTEIPDLDITDEIQNQEATPSYECTHEDPSNSSANFREADSCLSGGMLQEQMVELPALSFPDSDLVMNNRPSFCSELNEIEEDKVPDTPTSGESLHHLHKKILLLEKRDSGTEESLDGSVTSELDGSEGCVTIESLKSALRSERKALQALYAELEEERSASAVAANQTMAMINRLQEEKAAMQMEALQYQRMMEEQSEYDQEALQLLNELMVKREKEKQELEKEFESYRKKVLDHETKEKMRILKRSKDGSTRSGFSSASCSNLEDSDGLSVDLNQEVKDEEGEYGNHNTPVDAVLNLEESLADFEEERLSILEMLKVLEEKLMTLNEEEEQKFEDVRAMEDIHEENGNGHFREANGHTNGFSNEKTGKHHSRRKTLGSTPKSLLPFFDAIDDENGDIVPNGNINGFDCNGEENLHETTFGLENKKLAIEDEVDHLYERLQALEADREFLKHCISSLQKGDKGMDLLQEILHHLRVLRNVELRVRNLSDNAIL